jgi:hypothetical protein
METKYLTPIRASVRPIVALPCATTALAASPVQGIRVRRAAVAGAERVVDAAPKCTTGMGHVGFVRVPGSSAWSPPI